MNVISRIISHIIQRRRHARILHRFKRGDILTLIGGQNVSTAALVRNMANEPRPLAKWVPLNTHRHTAYGSAFYGQQAANSRGQSWLEPTLRGKFWMLFLVLTTIKRRDW